MILLSHLKNIAEGHFLQLAVDFQVSRLVTDSRSITNNESESLFFCINGTHHDGHQYIEQAYQHGVRAFVVEHTLAYERYANASFFLANSSIEVLQALATKIRKEFDYPVIGITGSNGKTIIKEWLGAMLGGHFVVVKSPKSYNSQIGVPLSVWGMQAHHTLAIFEAGISQPGEMTRLQSIIRPNIGIFTNIGSAHDEGFESRQHKVSEKAILFKDCDKIIYCADHEEIEQHLMLQYPNTKRIDWSFKKKYTKYQIANHAASLNIKSGKSSFTFPMQSFDAAFVENTVHCIITMIELGLQEMQIGEALRRIRPVKMRLEIKEGINQTYIIDDTYNNDLNGLEVALRFLSQQNQNRKRTVILSDIEQSGLSDADLYRRVATLLSDYKISSFIGIGSKITSQSSIFTTSASYFDNVDHFLKTMPDFRQETILVKGARSMHFEKIVSRLQRKLHGTFLEINLEALIHNLNYYKAKLAPTTKVMVMVKALAYGSGNKEVAQLLQHHNVNYLGVAYVDEAIELRENGINLPILVMNPTPESFPLFAQYNLEPEIYSLSMLRQFNEHYKEAENPPSIQIKVDTGMKRLGFDEKDLAALTVLLKSMKGKVTAVFTHLAAADSPVHDEFSSKQIALFDKMYDAIAEVLGYKPIRHILNSPGITRFGQYQYDMVRLGIGLYGYDGAPNVQSSLRTVGSLKTTVSQIKEVAEGESVGYNRSWKADRPSKIATIAIGYADGFRRAFSNGKGKVAINGFLVPVVGNVCMDMVMVDVTDVACEEEDEVIIFGENPTISQLAMWAGTIPYEILTNVNSRVKRVFVSE